MTGEDAVTPDTRLEPQCDCGYRCRGDTLEARIRDGQRHAREVHGIDVGADQVSDYGEMA